MIVFVRRPCSRLLVLVSFVLLAATLATFAQERKILHGHVPAATHGLQPAGRLPRSRSLELALGLPLHNREALTNLLDQLYDPSSPSYRQYLSSEEFAKRFGPTEADYEAVIELARANRLQVTATHPNRVLLDVHGTVGAI